ncbi:MAG: hypothetical protein IJH55_06945, partial [Romboutsia sp.]|nr:hypothetical protein [Romboutsia sp.]
MFFKNIKKSIGIIPILAILITGCSNNNIESNQVDNLTNSPTTVVKDSNTDKNENTETSHTTTTQSNSENTDDMFDGYKIIEVDGGNLSGHRESNVAVDIGFGDREYWAFTNEYGQLVKVVAKEIILQDDSKEPVN